HLLAARAGDAGGDGGGKAGAGLDADLVRVGERGVVARGAGGQRGSARGPDGQRRAAHPPARRLAPGGEQAEQPPLRGTGGVGTRAGCSSATSAPAWPATREPRLSPITWPRRQPCARETGSRTLRGNPSATRGARRGSSSSFFQSNHDRCCAACGAPAKQPETRAVELPASATSRPSAS